MAKVDIVEKDKGKMLLEIEYEPLAKLLALSFRILGIMLTLFFFFAFQSYIVKIISILVVLFFILDFLGILLFQKLIFMDSGIKLLFNSVVKNKYFEYSVLKVMKSNGKLGGGTIAFYNGSKKYLNFFDSIDLLPIRKDEVLQMKEILIKKNVIKGDENEWID